MFVGLQILNFTIIFSFSSSSSSFGSPPFSKGLRKGLVRVKVRMSSPLTGCFCQPHYGTPPDVCVLTPID